MGIFFVDKVTKEELQCIAVVFVDDVDLISEGPESFKMMQQTLHTHDQLHRVTGRHA